MANKLNIDRLTKALSEILSEKYGCKVTITAIPKDKVSEETTQKAS
jgi:hypothetical protein